MDPAGMLMQICNAALDMPGWQGSRTHLQLLDRLLGLSLLLMASIDHLPCLLNLLLQGSDGGLVLLVQLQGCLHLGCISHDLGIELAALLHQTLLAVCTPRRMSVLHGHPFDTVAVASPTVGLLQRPMKLLVLYAESLQASIAYKLLQDLRHATYATGVNTWPRSRALHALCIPH